MITRRNLFGVVVAMAATILVAGNAEPALAQTGGGNIAFRLSASMSAGATQAKAKYEQRDASRRKFTFELEKGTPGTFITVKHNGSLLGHRRIDPFGRAKIDIDTTEGNTVQPMARGQVISVWMGTKFLMSGTLR